MKRLLRLTVILAALIFVMINISLFVGNARPASKAVQYWHLTDCAPPCWAGITPNLTTQDEAVERITSLFTDFKDFRIGSPYRNYRSWEYISSPTTVRSSITLFSSAGHVYKISMGINFPELTLGEVVMAFGWPTCMFIDKVSDRSIFNYDNILGQEILSISAERPSITAPVIAIFITPQNYSNCQNVPGATWRGFRNVELYMADIANRK